MLVRRLGISVTQPPNGTLPCEHLQLAQMQLGGADVVHVRWDVQLAEAPFPLGDIFVTELPVVAGPAEAV